MINKVVYICVGTCKAEISEEQYNSGLTKCGGEGCTLKGHEFEKRVKKPHSLIISVKDTVKSCRY